MAQRKPRNNPPPTTFMQLTTVENTATYVRKTDIAAYGEAPEGYEGNAWIQLLGVGERVYVMETMDQITSGVS